MELPVMAQDYWTTNCREGCRYCVIRPERRFYNGRGEDANFDSVKRTTIEIAGLGIPLIEPSGGDLARLPWLPEGLELCNQLGLYSTISLSGSTAESRLIEWGDWWLRLPGILRLSFNGGKAYHNHERGIDSFDATKTVLEAAVRVRDGKPTLIVFTLMPGKGGNLNRAEVEAVVALAAEYGGRVKINLNPLFGTYHTRSKEECRRKWASLTDEEWEALIWLWQQPEVLLQSLRKVAYALEGGNDPSEPSCKALSAIVAISTDRKLIGHCYPSPYTNVPILEEGGLLAAMTSPDRLHPPQRQGTIEAYCEGCCTWCSLVLGWHYGKGHSISEWKNILLGI